MPSGRGSFPNRCRKGGSTQLYSIPSYAGALWCHFKGIKSPKPGPAWQFAQVFRLSTDLTGKPRPLPANLRLLTELTKDAPVRHRVIQKLAPNLEVQRSSSVHVCATETDCYSSMNMSKCEREVWTLAKGGWKHLWHDCRAIGERRNLNLSEIYCDGLFFLLVFTCCYWRITYSKHPPGSNRTRTLNSNQTSTCFTFLLFRFCLRIKS